MIAILTDKPNVGKEIARILGAQTRENGYMTGNGYMVTWTFGNMLSLAMPKDYGIERPEREAFPLNPAPFKLMIKHVKTDTGCDLRAVLLEDIFCVGFAVQVLIDQVCIPAAENKFQFIAHQRVLVADLRFKTILR